MDCSSSRSELSEKFTTAENLDVQEDRIELMSRIDLLLTEMRFNSIAGTRANVQDMSLPALAKKLYSSRRSVDDHFDIAGFATSPAWDIMLDLFQNEEKGTSVSVTSACIGAACPSTTALRWLDVLISRSLIEKKDDPQYKRRSYVVLTSRGREATIKALRAIM